jgi:hypothetical protein
MIPHSPSHPPATNSTPGARTTYSSVKQNISFLFLSALSRLCYDILIIIIIIIIRNASASEEEQQKIRRRWLSSSSSRGNGHGADLAIRLPTRVSPPGAGGEGDDAGGLPPPNLPITPSLHHSSLLSHSSLLTHKQ